MSNNLDDIKKILVLVEMNDGSVRQVLSNDYQKRLSLRFMKNNEKDSLILSEEFEPIELEIKE